LTSCDDEEDDDPGTTVVLPSAPTELMATSIDSTTIHIKWTASANEMDSNWVGYHLHITNQTGEVVDTMDITTEDHTSGEPYPVTGLTAGEIYTMELYAENSDGRSSQAASIMWSPAIRFTQTADGSSEIRIYERATVNFGSGLDLYYYDQDEILGDEKGARSRTVAQRADWNLALDTENGIVIGSGSQLYANAGYDEPVETTLITTPVQAESLNEVFDSEGLDSKNFEETTYDLNNDQASQVFYVKVENGADEYYAKLLLKYENGTWLQGTAPDRYISAEISFQEKSGVPYAEVSKESNNTK
jgi:hypothetical protein